MKHSLFALLASVAVLAGAISYSEARTPVRVNDAKVMESVPKALSEFGFFYSPRLQRSVDLIPYQLNTPLYSDGADKLRFIYVPHGKQITADGDGLLQFPVGTAIIKTFAFGDGNQRRLIETRVLLNRADGWLALPYRWNEEQTDARLALAGGRLPITRPDGTEISYRIPNKNQCKTCHSKDGEVIPIGPKLRNLSDKDLAELGVVERAETLLPMWSQRHADGEIEPFARAYLDVNCAHCHQPGGSASNSGLDLRWEQDDTLAIGIGKPPVAAGRGSGGHLVSIAPGKPDASILIHRMSSTETGVAMPELGKGTVDEEGVAVLREWIERMPNS
ncbi:MAG: SO2930 family diheme c-type cytochrome [Pseudomonadota bacterium]